MSFTTLGLAPALAEAASRCGFLAPTPVQEAVIPAILAGHDVRAKARTGSGKTGAYLLPLLHRIALATARPSGVIGALVIVPTRELARQVSEEARALSSDLPRRPRIVAAFGGASINPQMMALRGGADLLVATPGRLLDLVRSHAVALRAVRTLVLDEADRLLDLGFSGELNEVLDGLDPQRQTLLFSATYPQDVEALAQATQPDPLVVDVADDGGPTPDITQRAFWVDPARRVPLLRHLLGDPTWQRVLIFAATRYGTELVAHKLHRVGLRAAAFHGDMSQGARQRVLEAFKSGELQAMVATDVAARGIHIDELPVVVNYDLPRSADDHVHRIGRTGRAGERGMAVSLVTPDNEAHFRLIERRQGQRVPREIIAGFEPREDRPVAPDDALPGVAAPRGLDPNGGIKGRRKSRKDKLREAAAAGNAT